MAITGELEFATDGERERVAQRAAIDMDVGLREMGSTRISARILDLSTHGFRAETLSRLCPRTSVWLTLPGLAPQLARVVWSDGSLAGCQFVAPLHPAVFAQVLGAHR